MNLSKETQNVLKEYIDTWSDSKIVEVALIDCGASPEVLIELGFTVDENTPLCDEQIEVLNKLASKTKMDCWFWIEDREVFDLEEEKPRCEILQNFDEGVRALEENLSFLSKKEREVYENLLSQYLNKENPYLPKMGKLFSLCESLGEGEILVEFPDKTLRSLTGHYYIEDRKWYFEKTINPESITGDDFVRICKIETEDESWGSFDVSPLDDCLDGTIYISPFNEDNTPYFEDAFAVEKITADYLNKRIVLKVKGV